MGERWQPPKCTESPYLPIDYYSESEEMRRKLDREKEHAWSWRERRPVERYAAAEYQGRMSDFHTKMCQLATTAYRSVGKRKIAIPFPGKLRGLPAPVLVESVEVVLQVQDPWQINPNVVYLKISYYNSTEIIYPISVNCQYEVSLYSGSVIQPIPTPMFEQILKCENDIIRHFTQRIRRMANNPSWFPGCTEVIEQTKFEQELNERSEVRLNPQFFEEYYW